VLSPSKRQKGKRWKSTWRPYCKAPYLIQEGGILWPEHFLRDPLLNIITLVITFQNQNFGGSTFKP
jgi:hypothetical protein